MSKIQLMKSCLYGSTKQGVLQSQFEVLSVSFTCMDTTSVLDSQIANYFKDQQEKRNKKQISGTTTEPQEELMKNKSKSITFFYSFLTSEVFIFSS
jgi:hypothetical protein